jgi:hypothetical protein
MKRSLQLKENRSALNLRPTPALHPPTHDSRLILPPLPQIRHDQMQKTLSLLVLRMQTFAEQFPGAAADLLSDCLGSLRVLLT